MEQFKNSNRRNFFSLLARSAAAIGLTSISPSFGLQTQSNELENRTDLNSWFNQLSGIHKIVFDTISANDGLQILWAYTFLSTNNQVGVQDHDLGVMVVLRNRAIPLAMEDRIWKKYRLGKFFKINDFTTNIPSERNLYFNPKPGEMPKEGMGIKKLMERGVMFCVCETAMAMNSNKIANSNGLDPEETVKDWYEGVIPGIQPVPSGVLALNRVQERGASYCYAG